MPGTGTPPPRSHGDHTGDTHADAHGTGAGLAYHPGNTQHLGHTLESTAGSWPSWWMPQTLRFIRILVRVPPPPRDMPGGKSADHIHSAGACGGQLWTTQVCAASSCCHRDASWHARAAVAPLAISIFNRWRTHAAHLRDYRGAPGAEFCEPTFWDAHLQDTVGGATKDGAQAHPREHELATHGLTKFRLTHAGRPIPPIERVLICMRGQPPTAAIYRPSLLMQSRGAPAGCWHATPFRCWWCSLTPSAQRHTVPSCTQTWQPHADCTAPTQ